MRAKGPVDMIGMGGARGLIASREEKWVSGSRSSWSGIQ